MTETPVLSWVREWWPIVSTLGLAGLGWAMLYLRSQFISKSDFDAAIRALSAAHDEAVKELKRENADARKVLDELRARAERDESKIEQMPTREQVAQLAGKIERVEMVMQFLPDKDAVHRLEVGVAALHGELKEVAARIQPVGAIADRLQEFLLDQAKHR